jgi:hypothetical protein
MEAILLKKLFVLLFIFLLIGLVNAYPRSCAGKGQECDSGFECCNPSHFCVNDVCVSGNGKVGDECVGSIDCYGELKCEKSLTDGEWRCMECALGDQATNGVFYEGEADKPIDSKCAEGLTTCSCDTHYNSGSGKRVFRWTHNNKAGDRCSISSECEAGSSCNFIGKGGKKLCFYSGEYNCYDHKDCNAGWGCVDNQCVNTPTYQVTSTTVTTVTTTSTTVTTTTLKDYSATFDCMALFNITQGSDDGYEMVNTRNLINQTYSNGTWVSGGHLQMGNATYDGNYTIALTYRNVSLPYNVDITKESVFVNIAYPNTYDYEVNQYGTPLGFNLPEFNNQSKPSQLPFSTIQEQCNIYANGFLSTASCSSVDSASLGGDTGDHSGEWLELQPESFQNNLFYKSGYFKQGHNVTVYIDATNTGTLYFESYDTDDTLAPLLCINYTTSATEQPSDTIDTCDTDYDCPDSNYCATGWTYDSFCIRKKEAVFENPDVICYRDHECKSGYCTAHDNNVEDYPVYDGESPYDHEGQCIRSYYVDFAVTPEPLYHGSQFQILFNVYKWNKPLGDLTDTDKVQADSCIVSIDPINIEEWDTKPTAWAYTDTSNDFRTDYQTWYTGSKWNYRVSETFNVNESVIPSSGYLVNAQCNFGETTIGFAEPFDVKAKTFTTVKYILTPEPNQVLGANADFSFEFLNYTGKHITDATCTYNLAGDEGTFKENLNAKFYYKSIPFNRTGINDFNLTCEKAGLDTFLTISQFLVFEPHCDNGIKDEGEEGIDCGGECLPCDFEKKIPDDEACTEDKDCASGFCDPFTNRCADRETKEGWLCLTNNDCSNDGSAYCSTEYVCAIHNCTIQSDCINPLDWFIPPNNYEPRTTVCDSDGRCRFTGKQVSNQTIADIGGWVTPLSQLTVNRSGTLFYVFNCDDKNNGFKVYTDKPTVTTYNFAPSAYAPSLPSYALISSPSDISITTEKTIMIPELCEPNDFGFGGIPIDSERMYANITMFNSRQDEQITFYLDAVVFRKNLENSIFIKNINNTKAQRLYQVNVTNRTFDFWTRNTVSEQWVKVTDTGMVDTLFYNHSDFRKANQGLDVFYWRIKSEWNETAEGKVDNSNLIWLVWDEDTNWFKLTIDIHDWMIWIALAAIIIGIAYANWRIYMKLNRRGE